MIKLLKHSTTLKPIFIALSDDMRFHVLYDNTSLCDHNSIGMALSSAASNYISGISSDITEWERLSMEDVIY